ncbi:ATPase, T2SS/T4P/T4SS family [Eubacterium pyruvativorans]|uniref:ATPase, T2SS/T4P/T4SS family n=1 Tax=Eubacterium pyruvativorans TaxID=155865 RepID=UPI00156A1C7C|nr:ATPase, T2SS/T4P/T4SS family [Eubacterium pyruvativorans]
MRIAMNTGHDGSMSTGHGNSVRGMLRRLEAMYLMAARIPMDSIRGQIVEGIDVMVHLIRTADGKRQVSEVQELVSVSGSEYVLNPLFRLNGEMKLEQTGNRIQRREKLRRAGDEDGDRL